MGWSDVHGANAHLCIMLTKSKHLTRLYQGLIIPNEIYYSVWVGELEFLNDI